MPASSWPLATTLNERLASRPTESVPLADRELARAQGRFQRWRTQPPFDQADHFARRLAQDGASEAALLGLLGESADMLAGREGLPVWWHDLEAAYSGLDTWQPADLPEEWSASRDIGFLDLIAPLLAQARHKVRSGALALSQDLEEVPFDPQSVEPLLLGGLPDVLCRMLSRTMVLELHVARLRGWLPGDTPAGRFGAFVRRLRQRETAFALMREYPVLIRQVMQTLDRWATFALEFLGHLLADWEEVRALLPGAEPGRLVGIAGNAGDTHRGGRAVLIAQFESGAKVVYKPRSLAVDQHFQRLLAWINERGPNLPPFRCLKVVERACHGWVEYAQPHGCTTLDAVSRFYRRQGGYLALLYALEATDFHSENVMACGEHPVLLDLEALFHPRTEGVDLSRADDVAGHVLNYSVLRVSLLPRLVWGSDDSAGVDVSAIGASAGQMTPYRVALMEGTGTDSMRLVREQVEILPDPNRPTLQGTNVDLGDHTDAIDRGFEDVYFLLLKHREELLSSQGPLGPFLADEVRVILRESKTYSILHYESFHPDVLRDALDRDRLLDRLWIGSDVCPYLPRVIADERADLIAGDIPLFTTRPDSRDLWTSQGQRLPDFFPESGWELVQTRLRSLGMADLARQRWIIRASLATATPGRYSPSHDMPPMTSMPQRSELLDAAAQVGDRLEELAIRGGAGVSWVGLELVDDSRWALRPLGLDLYNGLPGIALFLAYLGDETGEGRYTRLARAATTTLLDLVPRSGDLGLGGFDGWGGVVYALSHLASLWSRPDLLSVAEKVALRLPDLLDRDERLDVISGAAGCIGGLLSLDTLVPTCGARGVACRCGEHLLRRAQAMGEGDRELAWSPHLPARAPLNGFSHGAAGMAWALLELSAISGEDRFRQAALRAMAYERGRFSAAEGNWPDYRVAEDATPTSDFFVAWCHGAPGIGLARLRALRHLDDAAVREEIAVAARTTAASGFGRSHCLCHGDLGNLEFLAEAGRLLGDRGQQEETERLTAGVLGSIRRDGWLCAAPRAVEAPGLMTGLAGIGMGLLRLAAPERTPCVLTMDRPGGRWG